MGVKCNCHHCAKFILKAIKQHFDEYSENQIKELIWKNSSSINYRIKINLQIKIGKRLKILLLKSNIIFYINMY